MYLFIGLTFSKGSVSWYGPVPGDSRSRDLSTVSGSVLGPEGVQLLDPPFETK